LKKRRERGSPFDRLTELGPAVQVLRAGVYLASEDVQYAQKQRFLALGLRKIQHQNSSEKKGRGGTLGKIKTLRLIRGGRGAGKEVILGKKERAWWAGI